MKFCFGFPDDSRFQVDVDKPSAIRPLHDEAEQTEGSVWKTRDLCVAATVSQVASRYKELVRREQAWEGPPVV